MTTKIYSKINPEKLLHMIVRDPPEGRINLCPSNQFLQCASLRLPKGTTFRAHKHNWRWFDDDYIPQESWVVIKGKVWVWWYDTDGTLLYDDLIEQGEASFTFQGYHNYEIIADDTLVFEYKTGPYINQETDKTFL